MTATHTAVDQEYAELLTDTLPRVIRSEKENDRFIRILEDMERRKRLSAAERELVELLTVLIEDFEEKHYRLPRSTPLQALQALMDMNRLRQKDLVGVFGTPSIVSEVLSGKRALNKEHIRKLSRRFNVSPELFI